MSQMSDEGRMSSDDLLKAAEELSTPDLERFASEIITLRARRCSASLTVDEARLISKINQSLPAKLQSRLDILVAKRMAGTLAEREYIELIKLTDQAEKLELQRVKNLIALARLRNTDLSGIMRELKIRVPDYA